MNDLLTLLDYDRWATARLLAALAPLSPQELGRDLHSSHGGVLGTLAHLYAADVIWMARLRGAASPGFADVPFPGSLTELESAWQGVQAERRLLVEGLEAQTVLRYANLKGEPQRSSMGEMVRHVVNHASYHRGQVVTLLRQLGHAAPNTDLIAFYRLQIT